MAEVSENAAMLITVSFQALQWAEIDLPPKSKPINLMVSLLFLAFYLEQNIDVIIQWLNKKAELEKFNNNKTGLGLQNKFGWFYNYYVVPDNFRVKQADKEFK